MAEDLDDLLALHHLLDKAVHLTEIRLLRHEILPGGSSGLRRRKHGHSDHEQRNERQRPGQNDHRRKCRHDSDRSVEGLSQGLRDHLTQRINVIGIDRHDIAMGVRVEIGDRQRLHVSEDILTKVPHGSLRNVDHDDILRKRSEDAEPVEQGHPADRRRKRSEIRIRRCQERHDIAVDQRPGKQRSLQVCRNRYHDTYKNQQELELVALHHVTKDPAKQLPGMLHLRKRTSAPVPCARPVRTYRLTILSHQSSPPLSKSPDPLIWDSYTSR